MGRVLLSLLILLVLVGVASQWVLPRAVEQGTAVALSNMLGTGEEVKVRLQAYPALRMLFGHFDRITVESSGVKSAGLVIDRLTATVEKMSVNMRRMLAERTLEVRRGNRVNATLSLTEDQLNQYLWSGVEGLRDGRLVLDEGKAVLNGYLMFNDKTFQLRAEGRFAALDASRVGFVADRLFIDGILVPAAFKDKLVDMLGGTELVFDLSRLPVPLTVREVEVKDGRLVIRGTGQLE